MTDEEKAKRYDHIMMTTKIELEEYEAKKKDAESRYEEKPIELSSYSKGKIDAYNDIIRTLQAVRC